MFVFLGRMEETAPQLQRFIEEAVKSNERNADEIYFMVVRSIEVSTVSRITNYNTLQYNIIHF